MVLASVNVGDLIVGGAAVLVALVFGYPAWRNAIRQNHQDRRSDEDRRIFSVLMRVMAGTTNPADLPAADNDRPSVLEMMQTLTDNSQEVAAVCAVLAHHVSDNHGGPLPPRLRAYLNNGSR